MEVNEAKIKKGGIVSCPRTLLCYDDIVSHKQFMRSKSFTHSFIASRHYNMSVFICTQKYKQVPKVCREQATAIFFYAASNAERETLAIDHAPANYSTRETEALIDEATRGDYSYLFINRQAPKAEQYRKRNHEIMRLRRG